MININTATATAADLLHPLIQTLRCHEKRRELSRRQGFVTLNYLSLTN